MKMNKQEIIKLVSDKLNISHPVVNKFERTPGGMTNDSYFVTINEQRYVVRIPGKGTDQLINRKNEKENLIFSSNLGINPNLIYFDVDTGVKITEKINSPTSLTPTLAKDEYVIKNVISIFKQLHEAKTMMNNRFELFNLMEHYESLVRNENALMMEKLLPLKSKIFMLKKIYESFHIIETPCHIDAACSNMIYDSNGELFLIDWEYSGMFDPIWDIATLFLSFNMNSDEEMFFLKYYFQREPTNEELQRILLHKIFQDYLWTLWVYFKDSKGNSYLADAEKRTQRAHENIQLYDANYNEDIVV